MLRTRPPSMDTSGQADKTNGTPRGVSVRAEGKGDKCMDRLDVRISPFRIDESPFGGVVFTVTALVNGRTLPEWLDVDAFFGALAKDGRLPVFNCSCGVLGCGGYFVDVQITPDAWIWTNRYHSEYASAAPFARCRFAFPWENVREVAGRLLATLRTITAGHPGEPVHSATTGPDLAERLPFYVEKYDALTV